MAGLAFVDKQGNKKLLSKQAQKMATNFWDRFY